MLRGGYDGAQTSRDHILNVDLPESASKILQQLAKDHDAAVAFATPNLIAIFKRARY
ncbi:hypothetical protein BJY52DRAFT_1188314 [Lactarius psammicola]|nr:hypothetical protein BJY52DRAFT_1188314 [Lactarius psammicola]